jgi:hypothetical protein
MPDVTHGGSDRSEHHVDVNTGGRAMRDAIDNNTPAIGAGRGCGRVDPAWLATTRLSQSGSRQASALRSAAVTQPHPRLSRQIAMSEALARRIVRVPAAQLQPGTQRKPAGPGLATTKPSPATTTQIWPQRKTIGCFARAAARTEGEKP